MTIERGAKNIDLCGWLFVRMRAIFYDSQTIKKWMKMDNYKAEINLAAFFSRNTREGGLSKVCCCFAEFSALFCSFSAVFSVF
jgi:hypothetical protein